MQGFFHQRQGCAEHTVASFCLALLLSFLRTVTVLTGLSARGDYDFADCYCKEEFLCYTSESTAHMIVVKVS